MYRSLNKWDAGSNAVISTANPVHPVHTEVHSPETLWALALREAVCASRAKVCHPRQAPWRRRYLRRFHAARCAACRRKIPPGSRSPLRGALVRERHGRRTVQLAVWRESEIVCDRFANHFHACPLRSTLWGRENPNCCCRIGSPSWNFLLWLDSVARG